MVWFRLVFAIVIELFKVKHGVTNLNLSFNYSIHFLH